MVFKRLPLPLTFFIEFLIIILLTLGAVGFMLPRTGSIAPVTLILDDSFSMHAGSRSPMDRARRKIDQLLEGFPGREFRILLAGRAVKNLGQFKDAGDLKFNLKRWTGENSWADLKNALAVARKMNTAKGPVYVFTDHEPWQERFSPEIEWNALGSSLNNTAIVAASRNRKSGKDRCMLIIANISPAPVATNLTISFPGTDRKPLGRKIVIAANKEKKVAIGMKPGIGAVKFSLSDDDLNFDNHITLLPEKVNPLRVKLDLNNPRLKLLVSSALNSSGNAVITETIPQLIISDKSSQAENINQLIFHAAPKGKAFSGPYTVNRNHAVTDGIDLKGVIWGGNLSKFVSGNPLIQVGNKPLLSTLETATGYVRLNMVFDPRLSTLQDTPNWPIFFWNLTDWLIEREPGIHRCNYRSGEKIDFKPPSGLKSLSVTAPNGQKTEVNALSGEMFTPDSPGKYLISAEIKDREKPRVYDFMVNPLNFDESNLQSCCNRIISEPRPLRELLKDYIDISWIFILAAILLLAWHYYLIRRADK